MDQLILHLNVKPLFCFDNLVVHAGNELAVATITSIYLNKGKPFPNLFLYGPTGTGKTHLLSALAQALKTQIAVTFISADQGSSSAADEDARESADQVREAFENHQPTAALIIDDVDKIASEYAPILWNLSNKLTMAGLPFILSSVMSPHELFGDNLHLRSRVTSGLVLRLDNPGDPARMLVLDKMARDRNVRLPHEVAQYLVNHKSRDLHDLSSILERLDLHSLRRGRRITLPLIRDLEKNGFL